jgi:hypothetical protein
MRPFARSDGGDRLWRGDEPVPCFAGCIDDIVVGLEDAIREIVGTQILPDFLILSLSKDQPGSILVHVRGAAAA